MVEMSKSLSNFTSLPVNSFHFIIRINTPVGVLITQIYEQKCTKIRHTSIKNFVKAVI